MIVAVFLLLAGCLMKEETSQAGIAADPPQSGNSPPTISGNPPPAIMVGETYSFTPQASDSDGDVLTFTIENKPTWADFDSETGTIFGEPTLGNVGSYANIRVSVSDGQASTSLNNFTVVVTQTATASTTLSWSAPTQNDDGSALTDLAGYKIYYGRSTGNYSNQVRIDNPSVTTFVVENLSPDTYYFAATAFNLAGIESRFSGEAVKAVN